MSVNKVIIEKERKFLLKKFPNLDPNKRINITQYYTDAGIRYRMSSVIGEVGVTCQKIKKIKIEKGINHEVDVEEISLSEFNNNRSVNQQREISKLRSIYNLNGKVFEIDLFKDFQILLLEVEDVDMEEEIDFPEEIKKLILLEVTGNENFDNYNLSLN